MFNRLLLGGAIVGEPIRGGFTSGSVENAFDGIYGQAFVASTSAIQINNLSSGSFSPWVGWDYGAGNKVLLSTWRSRHSSDLGAIGAGTATTVACKLQGSNDLVSWNDVGATDSKTDTAGLVLQQLSGLGSTPYRAWRLIYKLSGGTPSNLQVQEVELTVTT